MIEEWDLTSTNLSRIAERKYEVAVIPTGSVEAHNRHLPEGQDVRHTTHIARECCRRAWQSCQSVVCLPTIPYGVDCNLMSYPLTIHVSQTTLDAMIIDIAKSLRSHGIRKILIINGHGGNSFVPLTRQIQCDLDIYLFVCNWWTVGSDLYDSIFDVKEDHAGEMETSVALALYPDLVEMDKAGDGISRPFQLEGLRKGWIHTSRNFRRLNDHCASGDPSRASAEKGRQYLDLVISRMSDTLIGLVQSTIDESFPHAD